MSMRHGCPIAAITAWIIAVVAWMGQSVVAQSAGASAPTAAAPPPQSQTASPPPANGPDDTAAAYVQAKTLADEHARAGRFAEAATAAATAAHLSEALNGLDSIETAVARHNLGFVLRRAGRAAEAREPLEAALATYERLLPAIHPDVRNAVGELGQLYIATGRERELADIYARIVARAEREGAGRHINVANLLASRGFVLRRLNETAESEAAFVRALGVYEALGEIDGAAYQQTLAALLDRLDQSKRSAEAEAKARSAIVALAALGSKGTPNAVALYDRLSRAALEAGRAAEAKAHAEAALALLATADVSAPGSRADPRVGALNNLARASRALADHAGAEAAYERAIALLEASGDKANAGIVIDNLAVLHFSLGRLEQAERGSKRALALLEEALGRGHRSVGRAAGNLGVLLSEAGRHNEAEPLLRRALAIADAQAEKDPVQIGIIEDNLAGLLRLSGRAEEAQAHLVRALQLFQEALPAKHPRIATARNNLGRYLLDMGRYDGAEAALVEALSLFEAIHGRDSFNTAIPAANLAEVYTAKRRYSEARQLLARALSGLESVYGPRHSNLLATLNAAGRLELADGRPAAARAMFERAVAAVLEQRARSGLRSGGNVTVESHRAFLGLIEALWREGGSDARNRVRALEIAQLDSMTPAAVALAAFGARAGAGNEALGALTRERQDLAAEWIAADKKLSGLLAETAARDASEEARIRSRLAAIDVRLGAIDADLAERFPRFQDLARPSPLSVEELRRLMSPGEVAIQLTVAADATHVFAVSRQDVRWFRAAVDQRELSVLVRNLRCGLDASEWSGDGAKRCARLLGVEAQASTDSRDALPFDLSSAHRLYQLLLEPLADMIASKDLLVVASGVLTSLPLQVLIAAAPPPDTLGATLADGRLVATAGTNLQEIAWLGRRHAITVLPALASLAPLRRLSRSSAGRSPYVGIGNPLLTGPAGEDRRAFEVPACRISREIASPRQRPSALASAAATVKTALRMSLSPRALRAARGDTAALRQQWPLPETADELCRVASYARATPAAVVVGADATETRVKTMSAEGRLADARVVHFATHGLLAGETAQFLAGRAEPSLLLTPPETASEADDGLLTASEVATLRLDADWVVLSACNTASGDEVGAEALSGLARAFFFAGARSLLVSHWAVDSDATVQLVTAAFDAMAREPGLSQARALSKAMTSMIASSSRAAHPSVWAPFVVVGGSAPKTGAGPKPRARAKRPADDAVDWRIEMLQH